MRHRCRYHRTATETCHHFPVHHTTLIERFRPQPFPAPQAITTSLIDDDDNDVINDQQMTTATPPSPCCGVCEEIMTPSIQQFPFFARIVSVYPFGQFQETRSLSRRRSPSSFTRISEPGRNGRWSPPRRASSADDTGCRKPDRPSDH